MKQGNGSKKRAKAKHVTYSERVMMETYIRGRWPHGKKVVWAELGRYMGRGWRGVKAEYLRGLVKNVTHELAEYDAYSADAAEDRARLLDANKGPAMRLTNRHAEFIRRQVVEERMSPYVAVIRMRASGEFGWVPCPRTVYNAIGNGELEIVRENLPYAKTKRKQGRTGRRMAYRTAKGKSIDERPEGAALRKERGHCEMDTIVAPRKGLSAVCLLVLVELMTRRVRIARMPDRTQRSVRRALDRLERTTDTFEGMKSLTSDNGSEFWDAGAVERSAADPGRKRCELYYAHPFSAFERGANENVNRLIRRFVPKGADIGKYTAAHIKEIEDRINDMPRAVLGGLSANQAKAKIDKETAA
jgi:IS30 family transposase